MDAVPRAGARSGLLRHAGQTARPTRCAMGSSRGTAENDMGSSQSTARNDSRRPKNERGGPEGPPQTSRYVTSEPAHSASLAPAGAPPP